MEAKIDKDNNTITLSNLNDSVVFNGSMYGKLWREVDHDIYKELNAYWRTLPQYTQNKIFSIYINIYNSFSSKMSYEAFKRYIADQTTDLIEQHRIDVIKRWIIENGIVHIPDGFSVEYIPCVDTATTLEKTYTRNDYLDLLALAVVLRCMIPIWSEYIAATYKQVGTTFKEFYAFQLLNNSYLMKTPAIEKLQTYITYNIGSNYDYSMTLNGLNSEDFPFYLMSVACVRKIAIGDIRGIDKKSNLMTVIYKIITQRSTSSPSSVENIVKIETFNADVADSKGDRASSLENAKLNTPVTTGTPAELEFSVRDIYAVAKLLCINIDTQLLSRSIETAKIFNEINISDIQITLLQWVYKTVISPNGIMFLPKDKLAEMLGAMEAILWTRGHRYLAMLSTSYENTDSVFNLNFINSKNKIPQEMIDEINKIYPLNKPITGRKPNVITNMAVLSINLLSDKITSTDLRMTAADKLIEEEFNTLNRKFVVSPTTNIHLAKLVIELGNRSWS